MGILSTALQMSLNILYVLVLARILSSWFRPRYRTRGNAWFFTVDDMIWRVTEPFLAPIRNILPSGGMGFDFSPIILFLAIRLLGGWLVMALVRMGL